MADHATGTVTFLFTDIEGSTKLLQALGDRRYAEVVAEHQRLLRAAFEARDGRVVDTQGDAFLAAFPRSRAAAAAAVAAQQAIAEHTWPPETHVLVRMGLHTGEPLNAGTGYVGLDLHRAARICAAGHGGQILLSQTTRDLIADDLPDGARLRYLGEYRLKDLARPEHLHQLLHPHLRADFPPLRSLDTLPNNLPRQVSSFIGREREIAEVKGLLAKTALLTLTGAGGAGKTRLALQVVAHVLDQFADGVWLVELGAVGDPALVPQAAASALRVQEEPGRPVMATLIDYLQPKDLLLMLDNCEHLLAASSQLAETLLRNCHRLRIMATSREGLGVGGEFTYRVPSLSLPDPLEAPAPARLSQYAAVRLFVERARSSQSGFDLTDGNAAAIGQICARLDGIPLAIELAAARARVLTPDQIAERLDDRFRLLTGGSRTALPRQQTLRAAMDWSYELLTEEERALLRRIAVFAGGFALEAAEAICAGGVVSADDVLELLTHLVDKSLVLVDERGARARYRLLETVRQYGRDRMLEAGEAPAVRDRHLAFFLAVAEEAEPRLRGPDQLSWLDRLETEHDNLRAALEWALGRTDPDTAARLAGALVGFWFRRGYSAEGRTWLDRSLARRDDMTPQARAEALDGVGLLARIQGDFEQAREAASAALAIYRELGDARGMSSALLTLGIVARIRGELIRAAELHEESLTLRRRTGDAWGSAISLQALGADAWRAGEYGRAEGLVQESLKMLREAGDQRGIASALGMLGTIAVFKGDTVSAERLNEESLLLMRQLGDKVGMVSNLLPLASVAAIQGDHVRATTLAEEALVLLRDDGDRSMISLALFILGFVAVDRSDLPHAASAFRESLEISRDLGQKFGIARSLVGLATVALDRGEAERAAKVLGASERLRESYGGAMGPNVQKMRETAFRMARVALGEDGLADALAKGRAMPLEDAIEAALAIAADFA